MQSPAECGTVGGLFGRGVAQFGQSAAFGTQRSQVQILSPRFSTTPQVPAGSPIIGSPGQIGFVFSKRLMATKPDFLLTCHLLDSVFRLCLFSCSSCYPVFLLKRAKDALLQLEQYARFERKSLNTAKLDRINQVNMDYWVVLLVAWNKLPQQPFFLLTWFQF